MNRYFRCVIVSAVSLFTICCSTGPAPPKPGTPAFYWSAAKTAYAAGDYQKTSDNLQSIARTENEYTSRALAWNLVLMSGMVNGNMRIADNFEYGVKANRANPTPFRRGLTSYRTYAAQMAPQFVEAFMAFVKLNKDPKITLDFGFPAGNANPPADLDKVAKGELLADEAMQNASRLTLASAVVQAACAAVGAPEDVAKAQAVFATQPVQVPRETFLLAMANALFEQSQLYSREKLDQPPRMQVFIGQAENTLKGLPESKDTKALAEKIQKAVKADKSKR
jgi:hypothetical protein